MLKRPKRPDGFQEGFLKATLELGAAECVISLWTFFRLVDDEVTG